MGGGERERERKLFSGKARTRLRTRGRFLSKFPPPAVATAVPVVNGASS